MVHDADEQSRIVEQLDGVLSVQGDCERQLALLDELVQSKFVEMFEGGQYETRPLQELCDYVAGGSTPSMKHAEFYGGEVPFIKSGDVKSDTVREGALWLTDEAVEHGRARLIPADSVVVVVRSALLKRKMPCTVAPEPVVINQDLRAFHPIGDMEPSYLMWAIRAHEPELLARVRTVNTSGLDMDQLYNLPIPMAPYPLQQDFAAFVSSVEAIKADVRQQLASLQELYDSLAQQYFSEA